MEQVNVVEEDESIIRYVQAFVVQVDERFLRLNSVDPRIESGGSIQLSAMVALSFLPRPVPATLNLMQEFAAHDSMILDIRPDTGYYIPSRIHVMQFIRQDGTRIVADGLLINLTDYPGPLIRSSFLQDFVFPKNRIVPSAIEMRLGVSVTFEASVMEADIEGLNMRVIAEDEKGVNFPVYRGNGTVSLDASGAPYIQAQWLHGQVASIPVNEGAIYGCGIPITSLVGQVVTCTVCPIDPRDQNSYLEVVYFEPCADGPVLLEARAMAEDGGRSLGRRPNSRSSIVEVQCSRLLNEDNMQAMREAFMFIIDNVDAAAFKLMLAKYPTFVEAMIRDLGFDRLVSKVREGTTADYDELLRNLASRNTNNGTFGFAGGDGGATTGATPRVPTAPDFLPDEALLTSGTCTTSSPAAEDAVVELENAAAALSITSDDLQPSPRAEAQVRQDESSESADSFDNRGRGGTRNTEFFETDRRDFNNQRSRNDQTAGPVIRHGLGDRARPMDNLRAGRDIIEPVGRTRIADLSGHPQSRYENRERSQWPIARPRDAARCVGKVKPG